MRHAVLPPPDQPARRLRNRLRETAPHKPLDREEVARLTNREIERMTRIELIRAIRAMDPTLPQPDVIDRLAYCDRPTLERLVHLARFTCRHAD